MLYWEQQSAIKTNPPIQQMCICFESLIFMVDDAEKGKEVNTGENNGHIKFKN